MSGDDRFGVRFSQSEIDRLSTKERETGDGNASSSEDTKHAGVKLDRWKKEDGHLVAWSHSQCLEMVGKLARKAGKFPEGDHLGRSVRKFDPDGNGVLRMAIDTFVANVEMVATPLKEAPPFLPLKVL